MAVKLVVRKKYLIFERGLVDELAILHLHGGWGTRLSHNRRCNVTSKQYYYTGQYKHLNDLFDFKPNVNYTKDCFLDIIYFGF